MSDLSSREFNPNTPVNGKSWDAIISSFPFTHILQSWEWSQVKSAYGWRPIYRTWQGEGDFPQAAAMALERIVTVREFKLPMRVMYLPKGPLLANWAEPGLLEQVCTDLITLARERGVIFIKIDPDIHMGYGIPASQEDKIDPIGSRMADSLLKNGWLFSSEQIQFRNTVIINLTPGEDELLASMKQKTRYNLRLAGRKGVRVRDGGKEDVSSLYQMYAETALRDGFVIREREYYYRLWTTFIDSGMAKVFIAEVEGEAIAGMIVFYFGDKAWFMYGMSRERQREKMPNYLLQWEAIKWAKAAGCLEYDLWGAPESFSEDDPLWGVYRFKEGLGGKVVRKFGAWDFPIRPQLYRAYVILLPRLLDLMRKRGKARIRQVLDR